MYFVLSKNIIEMEVIPFFPMAKRISKIPTPLCEIVNSPYKLNTGVQGHLLPVGSLFSENVSSHNTVFGHYRDWCKQDIWKCCSINILTQYKSLLNLSSDRANSHIGGQEFQFLDFYCHWLKKIHITQKVKTTSKSKNREWN